MQLGWPFALIGAAVGAQLPAPLASGVIMALVLGLFGVLVSSAMPRLAIADAAGRAHRLPPRSWLTRAQRRRVWLLALATSTLGTLLVPALANPWSRPSEAPLAQLCATSFMVLAVVDAIVWLALAQSPRPTADSPPSANPYRDSAAGPPAPDSRLIAIVAARALVYDALLVAVVASALLVSR